MKNSKSDKWVLWIVVIVYVIIGIISPVIIKYSVFENDVFSNLSNDGWASFLGSYVGGVLGGLGTLIAMGVTISYTVKMRVQDKKDTDERIEAEACRRNAEYDRDKLDRRHEREADMLNRKTELRKEFADNVSGYVGRYVTHISNYFYSNREAERLDCEYKEATKNVEKLFRELNTANEAVKNMDQETEIKLVYEQEIIKDKYDKAIRNRDNILRKKEENTRFGNRLEANEAYFTLKAMMSGIEEASGLISVLEVVHAQCSIVDEEHSLDWIEVMTRKLLDEYCSFRDSYVNHGES